MTRSVNVPSVQLMRQPPTTIPVRMPMRHAYLTKQRRCHALTTHVHVEVAKSSSTATARICKQTEISPYKGYLQMVSTLITCRYFLVLYSFICSEYKLFFVTLQRK